MKRMAFIFTPAYPAAWLLFGMLFALAAVHFFAASWSKIATAGIYMVPLIWVALIARYRPETLQDLSRIDVLFAAVILVVLTSLTVMQGGSEGTWKVIRYMPFMMVVPYVCGRLMRAPDVDLFSRITLFAGIAIMPLLLIDRFTSPGRGGGRWSFFGQDHGALLVGALLAAALSALCVRVLGCRNPAADNDRPKRWACLGLIGLATVFLVWVMARGWLLAGLAAVAVVCLSARHRLIATRIGLLAAVLAIAGITLVSLPPVSGDFYAKLLTKPATFGTSQATAEPATAEPATAEPATAEPATAEPALGEASCRPFKEGVDSVAMRWVLYREAQAMLWGHPYIGVGATRFGGHSCTGPGGFPHSMILQGFAELGLIGGGLLAGLLALATVTLVRPFLLVRQRLNWSVDAFVLALFAMFLVADQIYGNYFMSVGTWLMLGMAAGMDAEDKYGSNKNV